MTNEQCFAAWAPDGVAWSQWAKPALFAQLDRATALPAGQTGAPPTPGTGETPIDLSWVPDPRGDTTIVVDLPGAESTAAGLALANLGYRPVPLYNGGIGPSAVIDTEPIARALRAGAESLGTARIRPDAPPAFLVDADRMRPKIPPAPGKFDNRWVVFPQDFPSATYLITHGVREVLVLRRGSDAIAEDLAHVLLRWQQAGVRILAADVTGARRGTEIVVRPPSLFRRAWYRVAALAGLRRSSAGGFGAVIPIPSSGG